MASNGVYGTKVAANVTADEIEIFYSYSPTRNSDDVNKCNFKKLPSGLLTNAKDDEENVDIEGLKNLKLPLQYFNRKGFYTIYIRPKEVRAVINNVSTLASYPDVRGIVLDIYSVPELTSILATNNGLVGYRIAYINSSTHKRENYYRLVTSNNKCEPVEQSLKGSNQNTVRYNFNESGTLTFVTLTPSVAPSFKPNATPYIGQTSQEIVIINTKFEPILIDIEMVDKDAETISTMLEGSQLRSLDNGLVTTYNENNEIYHQSEHYSLKDKYTGEPIYEVKKNKTESINFDQTIDDK